MMFRKNKKVEKHNASSPFLSGLWLKLVFFLGKSFLLGDACFLTGEFAEVIQLGTAHLADFVYFNAVNVRRLDREDTLYTDSSRHFAHCEALLVTLAAYLDDYTTVKLDSLF